MATRLRDLEVDLITQGRLERGLGGLREEFAGTFSAEAVERYMAESFEALGGARLKDFVPLFVQRFARERLRALGQVEGTIPRTAPRCCSSAYRTRDAARWRQRCSTTTPRAACMCAQQAARRPTKSTPTS